MIKRKSKEKLYKNLCILLLIIVGILSIHIIFSFFPETEVLLPLVFPDASILGFEKVNNIDVTFRDDSALITLAAGCYKLAAWVEAPQGLSIQNALQNKSMERPNAHELARDVFNTLDIKVLMVKITELRNNSYFARILLRQKNAFLNFDVRPSDGIAIALRTNSPIYINNSLLKQHGEYIC